MLMALGRAFNEASNSSSVFSEVAGVAPLRASRDHRAGCSKGRPARPQRVKGRGVPVGYGEDLNDATCLREAASAKAGNDAGGLFQHPASARRLVAGWELSASGQQP